MPVAAGQKDGGVAPVLRCAGCGAPVAGTGHTRIDYRIGHFVLHGGRTEETTVRRGDDEAPFTYRRLIEPRIVVSCPGCFVRPEMRRLWHGFGEEESAGS